MKVRNKKVKRVKSNLKPTKLDPTRTAGLRAKFVAEINRRFSSLKTDIIRLIDTEDSLGLKESSHDSFTTNEDDNCGTGSGGFKLGNTCAGTKTDSPEFRRWFGNSKAVNRAGNPLRMYHGTTKEFDSFDPDKGLDLTDKLGTWLAASPDLVEARLKSRDHGRIAQGSRTIPVYASIENPKVFRTRRELDEYVSKNMVLPPDILKEATSIFDKFYGRPDSGGLRGSAADMRNYRADPKARERINDDIISQAHDWGMSPKTMAKVSDHARQALVQHTFRGHDGIKIENDQGHGTAWVAFHPNQVKSALANRGTYDRGSNLITHANPQGCNQYTGPGCAANHNPSPSEVDDYNDGVWTKAKRIASKVGAKISHAEHVMAEWTKHEIALQVMRLPTPIQTAVTATYFLTRMGTKAAFVTWMAGQAFAERVAREQGLSDEEASTLRGVLATRDIVGLKPIQVGIVAGGLGEYAPGLSLIPPATAEYLLRSTVKNPLAVARAAGKLVKGAIAKVLPQRPKNEGYKPQVTEITRNALFSISEVRDLGTMRMLSNALKDHGYDDWYVALLSSTTDELGVDEAVDLADRIWEAQPTSPVTNSNPNHDDLGRFTTAYHGSKLPNFDMKYHMAGRGGYRYWTDSDEHAKGYAGKGGTVIKSPLRINKPLNLMKESGPDDITEHEAARILKSKGIDVDGIEFRSKSPMWRQIEADGLKYRIQDAGYDAIVLSEKGNDKSYFIMEDSQIVRNLFSQEQVRNANWRFQPNPDKVRQFQDWLRSQIDQRLRSQSDRQLWERFAQEGFQRGQARSYDDYMRGERGRSPRDRMAFYDGGREQFLKSSFHNPVAVETVQLLAGRAFDELKNMTADMSTRLSRVLMDGLVKGQSPIDIARTMVAELDISKSRAELIARTEIVRAHSEGQLVALEALGVGEVGIMVEWSVSGVGKTKKGYPSPCKLCAPLQGIVLKVSEAHGLIPRHPRCMCSYLVAPTAGGKMSGQKTTKPQIDKAIGQSRKDGDDWAEGLDISKDRSPTGNYAVWNRLLNDIVANKGRYLVNKKNDDNCGTGAGGFHKGNTCAVSKEIRHSKLGRGWINGHKYIDVPDPEGEDKNGVDVHLNPSPQGIKNWLRKLRNQPLKAMLLGEDLVAWDEEDVHHNPVADALGWRGYVPFSNRIHLFLDSNGNVIVDRRSDESKEVKDWADKNGFLINTKDKNCGTGAGGFKEGNTCASSGGDYDERVYQVGKKIREGLDVSREELDSLHEKDRTIFEGRLKERRARKARLKQERSNA